MDEADLLSELSAIGSAAPQAGSSSKPAGAKTTRTEEILAGLVREYLEKHNLSAVAEFFKAERPPTKHAIGDRKELAAALNIEKLVAKNKKEANYPSLAEIVAHYYFSSNLAAHRSKKKDKKHKHKKKDKDKKEEAKAEDVESDIDSDEAADLAREAALKAAIKPDAEFDNVSDQKVQLISSNIGRYNVGDDFTGGPTGDIAGRIVNKLADDGSLAGPGKITVALSEARKTFALQSSNVGKYAPGMPFDNGTVEGFVLKVRGSTNDGNNGPGQVVIALKPTINTDTNITYVRRGKITKKPGDINGGNFTVEDVKEARILLLDHVGDVLINNVNSADVVVGPASGCVRLKDCNKCNIVVACREIKIAKCDNIRVFVSAATPPIVGWGSKNVFIGPFTAAYPGISEHFAAAELNPRHNCWRNSVDRDAEKKRKKSKSKSTGRAPFVLMDAARTFDEEGSKFHFPLDTEPDAEVVNPVTVDAECIDEELAREKERAKAKEEAEAAAKAEAEAAKKAEIAAAEAKAKAEKEAAEKKAAEEQKAAEEAAANAVPEVMTLKYEFVVSAAARQSVLTCMLALPRRSPMKDLSGLKATPLGGLKPAKASPARPDDDIAALIAAQKKVLFRNWWLPVLDCCY